MKKIRIRLSQTEKELKQMRSVIPDYDVLEQTSREGLLNILVGVLNKLEQYKKALEIIKTLNQECPYPIKKCQVNCGECIVSYALTKAKGG